MPRYDLQAVKSAAVGRWSDIIVSVGGIADDFLTTAHTSCPKCGGSTRWRVFQDFAETGGGVCNQCGKFGDGLALIEWATGRPFPLVVASVAEFLGVPAAGQPGGGKRKRKMPAVVGKPGAEPGKRGRKPKAKPDDGDTFNPLAAIEPMPWNPLLVGLWCAKKRLSLPAVEKSGATLCRYKGRFTCVGFPIRDPETAGLIGWTIYEVGGGMLPVWERGNPIPVEWAKTKIIKQREKP